MNNTQPQAENTTRQKINEFVETLVCERQQALKKNDVVKANEIQQELSRLNVGLQDFRSGTRWRFS